jgi:hypothetical protein
MDVVTQEMIRRVKAAVLLCSNPGGRTFLGATYRLPPGGKVGFSRKGRGIEPKFPCPACGATLAICDAPKNADESESAV